MVGLLSKVSSGIMRRQCSAELCGESSPILGNKGGRGSAAAAPAENHTWKKSNLVQRREKYFFG